MISPIKASTIRTGIRHPGIRQPPRRGYLGPGGGGGGPQPLLGGGGGPPGLRPGPPGPGPLPGPINEILLMKSPPIHTICKFIIPINFFLCKQRPFRTAPMAVVLAALPL